MEIIFAPFILGFWLFVMLGVLLIIAWEVCDIIGDAFKGFRRWVQKCRRALRSVSFRSLAEQMREEREVQVDCPYGREWIILLLLVIAVLGSFLLSYFCAGAFI